MNIGIPIEKNDGIESEIYGHFGSAPFFMVYDTATKESRLINNKNEHHEHGACNPLKVFEGVGLDVVIVGGIGGGALMKLNQAGVRVCQAASNSIQENIDLLKIGRLPEFTMQHTCKGHSHGGGCSH